MIHVLRNNTLSQALAKPTLSPFGINLPAISELLGGLEQALWQDVGQPCLGTTGCNAELLDMPEMPRIGP
jgi:hypothetical protein